MRKIIEASGLGNSFLIVDQGVGDLNKLSDREVDHLHELLIHSRRDSLLVTSTVPGHPQVDPAQKQMRILERDGTESLMCGNGLRALAQYFFESEQLKSLFFQTRAGLRSTRIEGLGRISADLGNFQAQEKIKLTDGLLHDSNVGEPHAVIVTTHQQVDRLFEEYGFGLAHDGRIQTSTGATRHLGTRNLNAVVIDPKDPGTIYNRTFERGVNHETKACGTGSACAASIYAREMLGINDFDITVVTNGGKLSVKGQKDQVTIEGPAKVEKIYLL